MFSDFPTALIALIIALAVLIKGSDLFLESASKIAKYFKVGGFFIGLTVISLSTSLPELATSITASFTNKPGIIMGNIIGSNIANIGLVLAVTLIITTIAIKKIEYENIFIMLISALLFSLFATDLQISRFEAVILLGIFFIYFSSIFKAREKIKKYNKYFLSVFNLTRFFSLIKTKRTNKKHRNKKHSFGVLREFIILFIGLILIVIGAKVTINSAIDISFLMHVPEAVIATIFIAVGTSLPELFVSFAGIKKGFKEMVLGNIIGSNVFNTFAIIGISGIIKPIKINPLTLSFSIPAMIIFSSLLYILLRKSNKLTKLDGIILFVLYSIFLALLLFISVSSASNII